METLTQGRFQRESSPNEPRLPIGNFVKSFYLSRSIVRNINLKYTPIVNSTYILRQRISSGSTIVVAIDSSSLLFRNRSNRLKIRMFPTFNALTVNSVYNRVNNVTNTVSRARASPRWATGRTRNDSTPVITEVYCILKSRRKFVGIYSAPWLGTSCLRLYVWSVTEDL